MKTKKELLEAIIVANEETLTVKRILQEMYMARHKDEYEGNQKAKEDLKMKSFAAQKEADELEVSIKYLRKILEKCE